MQIVTPKQMQRIEEKSERMGVSKKQLMENAGRALAERIDRYCRRKFGEGSEERSVVFLTGKGNNSGDCFVAANILVYRGYRITIIDIGGQPESELAREMYSRLPQEHINFIDGYRNKSVESAIEAAEIQYMSVGGADLSALENKKDRTSIDNILLHEQRRMQKVTEAVRKADVLVDGVYGTGFHGQLDKNIADVFAVDTGAYCIAVDVPSGGNCVGGTVAQGIFKADETLTFGYIKTGMTQFPLREYCGKITIADIGLPDGVIDITEGERKYYRIDREFLSSFPPKRRKDAHKGDFGTVLVIAGSSSMRGAAAFASLGALRSGAGLVRLASVEKCIDTAAVLVPEATYIELECDDYGHILFDPNRDIILRAMKKADVIVIGCGMGVTQDTIELTKFVTANAECPVIIDADGINCIACDIDILVKKRSDIVITPHVGEMARLLNCEKKMIADNRIVVAEKYAEKYGITVVLKGAGTVVADGNTTAVNHTGNAGMSVGGSGDILAGIIGSIAAQGMSIFDSACAGVYIHGLAGDSAAAKLGMEAMLPRDMIDNLPDSFRLLKEKKKDMLDNKR